MSGPFADRGGRNPGDFTRLTEREPVLAVVSCATGGIAVWNSGGRSEDFGLPEKGWIIAGHGRIIKARRLGTSGPSTRSYAAAPMTPPQQRGLPSEEDVRSLVERILDGAVGEGGSSEEEKNLVPEIEADESRDGRGIAIGADHGGFALKERIAFKLKEAGWEVTDCGTDSHESVDYPDFAHAVARRVGLGECRWGIVIDGAGIGSAMVANKVPGVRAATCYDISSARNSREHNHANVLCLGAGLIGEALAWQIVEEWLATEWAGGRHARRVAKIDAIEQQYSKAE